MSLTGVDDLLGAWRLERAVQVFDDGERRDEFGPNPNGYLCYNPSGIMSATLGGSQRPLVSAGDPLDGTDDEYAKIAKHFIAYAGPFSVDVDAGIVTHHVDVSLFPNWQGDDQVRHFMLEGKRLSIVASDRTAADGRTFHSELIWWRV